MSTGRQMDPFASFRFKVDVGNGVEAHFQSVSGLSAQTEVVPQKEGGVNDHVHQLKGVSTFPNIVLKRGVTTSSSFFDWILRSISNSISKSGRANGTITLYSEDGATEIQKWKFVRAWPCKWEGGSFDTSTSAALIETLELAHEGLQK